VSAEGDATFDPNQAVEPVSSFEIVPMFVAEDSYANSLSKIKPPFCAGITLHMTCKPPKPKNTVKMTKSTKTNLQKLNGNTSSQRSTPTPTKSIQTIPSNMFSGKTSPIVPSPMKHQLSSDKCDR
jgi:hypothetical protein